MVRIFLATLTAWATLSAAQAHPNHTNNAASHHCPTVVRPVCGKNGVTYNNICESRRAGTRVAYRGACKASAPVVKATCKRDVPVCGADGRTYRSAAAAHASGVNVVWQGFCAQRDYGQGHVPIAEPAPAPVDVPCSAQVAPVCGDDGKVYANACLAERLGVKVRSAGQCRRYNFPQPAPPAPKPSPKPTPAPLPEKAPCDDHVTQAPAPTSVVVEATPVPAPVEPAPEPAPAPVATPEPVPAPTEPEPVVTRPIAPPVSSSVDTSGSVILPAGAPVIYDDAPRTPVIAIKPATGISCPYASAAAPAPRCGFDGPAVCATNGITYVNACSAAEDGVAIKHMGSCTDFVSTCPSGHQPVCGVDGLTYQTPCDARTANVRIHYKGNCRTASSCPTAADVTYE